MLFLKIFSSSILVLLFNTVSADDWFSSLPFSADFNISYDNFRSIPEGSWEGNTGAFVSLNLGMPLTNFFSTQELRLQLGGSYGVYDWSGRGSSLGGNPKTTQQQALMTAGAYTKTLCASGINASVVYDWMINKNLGVFALHANIAQVRFQTGYQFCYYDEIGVWGAFDVHKAHAITQGIPVDFRAISQVNLFWRHTFENCAETVLWTGTPVKKSLMFSSGRAGRFIFGSSFSVPLNECLSIEGHAAYMRAKALHGVLESRNYAADVSFGLTYSFGGCSREKIYLPLANNSNFLIDTNLNY